MFLLRPPNSVRRGPFFERKSVCNSQENAVRTRCAAIVNHPAVLKILRVVNLLRVVFLVRRGPLGTPSLPALSFPLSPHRPWLFLQGAGRGRPRLVGGGVLGRKGVEGGGGPPSGTWGQTHIWGHSNHAISIAQKSEKSSCP